MSRGRACGGVARGGRGPPGPGGRARARRRPRGRDPRLLWDAYQRAGAQLDVDGDTLIVSGLTAEDAGEIALAAGVAIYELTARTPNLEQIFLDLATVR